MDDEIINRIGNWLIHGGAQIQTGTHAGAVAGWLDEAREPAFAYPEITGYYLTCLAFMREVGCSDAAVSSNANRAVAWLRAIFCSAEPPVTRYYCQPINTDWRNGSIFSFDLAMIVRGLAGVIGIVDEHARCETICAIQCQLRRFISSEGDVLPYLSYHALAPPDRWSTRRGPFQMKTAAALFFSGHALDEDLEKACIRTLEKNRASLADCPEESHAGLYAVEGHILFALNGHQDAWRSAVLQYAHCVREYTCARSDVAAQFLRAGCILRREGLLCGPEWDKKLEELATAVKNFVGESGQVFYEKPTNGIPRHENSWSAIFAYQALTYYLRSADCPDPAWLLLC